MRVQIQTLTYTSCWWLASQTLQMHIGRRRAESVPFSSLFLNTESPAKNEKTLQCQHNFHAFFFFNNPFMCLVVEETVSAHL